MGSGRVVKVTYIAHHLESLKAEDMPAHLAIGMFDGVHLGHQAVIQAALSASKNDGSHTAALCFDPHPSHLFRPDQATQLIMPQSLKQHFLSTLGIDGLIILPFTADFASIDAEDFLPYLKKKLPPLKAVYVGQNFRFGKGRKGDVNVLTKSANEHLLSCVSIPQQKDKEGTISSTRIREALRSGAIGTANSLLGYPYYSIATVVKGNQVGSHLGFPTLNMEWAPELQPKYGVYSVLVQSASKPGQKVRGIANYGVKPTVEAERSCPLLEVHILDGDTRWTNGDPLNVQWLDFIREERRFKSVDALEKQIRDDCVSAKQYFSTTLSLHDS